MIKTLGFILSEMGSHWRETGREVVDPVLSCPDAPSVNACCLVVLLTVPLGTDSTAEGCLAFGCAFHRVDHIRD